MPETPSHLYRCAIPWQHYVRSPRERADMQPETEAKRVKSTSNADFW